MKILIFRSGAFGDLIVITPFLRHLHSKGHELYVVTSERGMQVLKGNPHIKSLIKHNENIPIERLADEISHLQRKNKCERVIDFSESIEVSLSQHPRGSDYKLPKQERLARFNRNFYEYSFEHAGESWEGVDLRPELFFDEKERMDAKEHIAEYKFNILVGMSGSGNHKAWPYIEPFCEKVCAEYPDVHIITVGDLKCQLIEPLIEGRITNLSGNISMRTSMALTGLVDMVIAPDTGIIHAAGCYDTPKICLLGHTTHEMITKHFANAYPVQSDEKLAPCSPCSLLIYDMKLQCPLNPVSNSSICMNDGMPLERVYEVFKEAYAKYQEKR